jgi:tetratricopeptide (TPR) repeat protein
MVELQGNVAFKKKDFKTAIECYSEAIQCDGNNATYYSNRAAAYLAMCRFVYKCFSVDMHVCPLESF